MCKIRKSIALDSQRRRSCDHNDCCVDRHGFNNDHRFNIAVSQPGPDNGSTAK